MPKPLDSATALLRKIQEKHLRCADVLELHIQRLEAHNPSINAVVATNLEGARERAKLADAALSRGESWGPLHGLPMTVKDTFEVPGMPTTAGAPSLRSHVPNTYALAVQRLVDAGAIVFGKTNVPLFAGDFQTYNRVYGTTNNPWDTSKTPGGSSGGAAASLAAGMTPLELGSDIGGSIRTPAHYCGVYGHKPTYDIIPLSGHIPGPPGTRSTPDLAVAGPLSRCAQDLSLALSVLAGPNKRQAKGWSLQLPPPRHKQLSSYKIAAWLDDDFCPLEPDVKEVYDQTIQALTQAGATVVQKTSTDFNLREITETYVMLLASVMGSGIPRKAWNRIRRTLPMLRMIWSLRKPPYGLAEYLRGMTLSHRQWVTFNEKRFRLQHRYAPFFEEFDVLLTPVVPWTAIPHMQEGQMLQRSLQFGSQSRPYLHHIPWIAMATLLGLPATSAPVGQSPNGLPVNIQIVGGAFQDYTCIAFAEHLASVTGGFSPPPLL